MKRIFYVKGGSAIFWNSFWINLLIFFIGSYQGMSLNYHQQPGDTTVASQFNIKAIELARSRNYDSAISYFKKAAAKYMEVDVWNRFFYAHHQVGYLLNTQYKYPETFHYLDSIEDNYSQQLNPLQNSYQRFYGVLAWSQFSMLNYEKALYYFKLIDKGASQNPNVKPAQILFSKYYQGIIFQRIGQYDQALKYMLITKDIGDKHGVYSYLGMTYNNLGIIYRNLGEYERALEFYKKALTIEKQRKQEIGLTPLYNNLGMIYYYLKDYDAALKELNYAIGVLTDYTSDYYSVESALINTKALVLINQDEYTEANNILQKILAREVAKYGEAGPRSGPTLDALGELYSKMGDYPSSNNYYDESVAITKKVLGPKNDKIAEVLNHKGKNYLKAKMYQDALNTFQQTLISLTPDFNDLNYQDNPNMNAVILDKVELIEAQYLKSKVLLAMFSETSNINYLLAAESSNQTATELVDIVRKNMLYESSKMNLSKRAKTIFEQAIVIALLLEKETGQSSVSDIFAAMENSKAYLLSESMQRAKALGYTNLPESIIFKEDSFRTKIKVLENKRASMQLRSKDPADLAKISEQLFVIKGSFEEYKQSYVSRNSVYQHNMLNLSAYQANLAENELIIEYFAGENQLYGIALSKNKVSIYELGDYKQQVNELVRSVRNVQNLAVNDYQFQAIEVYNIILAPILADYKVAKRLVIVPDKQLGFIPFDALVTNLVHNPGYNSLAYLIKKYTLMQHQTVGLYIDQQHRHEETSEPFIGFAPDFDENELLIVANNQLRSELQPLPFAKKEVETISIMLDGVEVIGASASESYLKNKAASFNILHLATHAIIDEDNPLYSKLVLAFEDSTTTEDGELHSYEIYGMKLNCALVTLSACNTGTGKYLDGEGIFSLGRSFLLAGAESVLTSLWEVSDQSTSQIMESFYMNIKKGATSPEALREAKLNYLKTSDLLTANPHYWAGFVFIGQSEKVFNSYRYYYWIGAFVLLFIGITLITIKLNRRKSLVDA